MTTFGGLIGEAFVRIRPDLTAFRLETQAGIGGALRGVGLGAGGASGLAGALKIGGITAGIAAFALAAKQGIAEELALERQLNSFEGAADATADQMERVAAEARTLGADLSLPGIGAGTAAGALTELAQAGFTVNESIRSAHDVLELSVATNLDYADSVQIVTDAIHDFNLSAADTPNVSNLLFGGSKVAGDNIVEFAQALDQVGPTAAGLGLTIEQTAGAIALLGKNGLAGSEGGSALEGTLERLIPTSKQAMDATEALGIQIDRTRSLGEQLPDVLDQYAAALNQLDPVLRQQVLQVVFGAQAQEAANILTREGGQALRDASAAAAEVGQVQEAAAGKTGGLSGAFANLKSQGETLAGTFGEVLSPAVADLVGLAAGGVGAVNDFAAALGDLNDVKLPDFVPGDVDVGGIFDVSLLDIADSITRSLDPIINTVEAKGTEAGIAFAEGFDFSAVGALTGGGGVLPDGLDAKSRIEGRRAGEQLGRGIGDGIADGIISAQQEAVNAARRTLREVISAGKDAVQEAIREGREAVRASAIDARSNLIGIGQVLAADALRLLEEGPLARRIDALRLQLDRSQAGNERRRLTQGLRDAERSLADAERQAETAGPLTAQQTRARSRFLEPFVRDVKDAKAALSEFSTESVIGQLEAQAEAQKRVVQEGIADLIVQFNAGAINVAQANTRLANLLASNGVEPYGEAGQRLGLAFRTKFELELKAVRDQTIEIARGINVPQIGLEPNVVSPTGERRRQDTNIAQTREDAEARRQAQQEALNRAINAQRRAAEDNTDAVGDLTKAIRDSLRATGKRPTAATQPGSSGDRSSGRTP